MIGRTVALLEKFLNHPILKYHCIIHQVFVRKMCNFQHAMISVVKCANKIRARG